MGQKEKIVIREAELGPVIARVDHQDGAIEVNASIFYKLPPMVQEFVLCHEVTHLANNEWDEGRTNQLASALFLKRAKDAADREARSEFLSYLDCNGGYSNFDWFGIVTAAAGLGYSVYGIIQDQNANWYSWDKQTQKANLNVMLSNSFEKARKSSTHSASEYFWEEMYNWTNRDSDLNAFLKRDGNTWVNKIIKEYEKQYGFKFDEVTPVDLTAYPLVMVALGIVAGIVVYMII